MTAIPAIPAIVGRPQPPVQLISYLTELVAPQVLIPDMLVRVQMPPEQLVSVLNGAALQRREELLRASGRDDISAARRENNHLRQFPIGATIFGRHYDVIDALKRSAVLPRRPFKILQGGAGVYEFNQYEILHPGFVDMARGASFAAAGSSYESAELAMLAGEGGTVHLVELDEKVIDAIGETLYRGMILSVIQPAQGFAVSKERLEDKAVEAFLIGEYRSWRTYLDAFVTATMRGKEISCDETGIWSFVVKQEIADRVEVTHGDISTMSFSQTYDIAWLTNVYEYMSEAVWLYTFFRAIASLPIRRGHDELGGLLVVDRFDVDFTAPEQIRFQMGEILTLAGMTVWREFPRAFEQRGPVVVASRTHESPWLSEQLGRIDHFF